MSKRCARDECGKTVYPLEELKCLDKVWHKSCFKCTVCGMALNMKNYKGYNKMPYCEPHYPKTVASVVADTPEMRRIAENTKLQSQIAYHAEYEKMKGTKIQIADDPEISRHLANTKVQSQVAYTGELAKRIDQEQMRHHTQQTQEQGRKKLMEKHGISKESGKETDKPESDEKVAQKAEPSAPESSNALEKVEIVNPKFPPVPKPLESAKVELTKTLLNSETRRPSLTSSTKPKLVSIPKKFESPNDSLSSATSDPGAQKVAPKNLRNQKTPTRY